MSIHEAIDSHSLRAIRKLLAADPSRVHARNQFGDQPLHRAASLNRRDVAALLIRHGASVDEKGEDGKTPLHYAARHGCPEAAALLIAKGANIEARDDHDWTPLLTASRGTEPDYEAVARLLLRHGASVDLNTALCLQDADRVRSFLASDPHAVRKARFPEYLLTDAVILIELKLNEKGLAFRPSLNSAEMRTAQDVIHSYKDIVELLIAQRSPRNSVYSALIEAVQLPDTEVARLLLEYGAKALKAYEKNSLLGVLSTQSVRTGHLHRLAVFRKFGIRKKQ